MLYVYLTETHLGGDMLKKFILAQSEKEFYTSNSGLALVGLCLNKFCSLPMNVEITDDEIDYVIFAVRSFYRK
jgi:hypothetical protein